MRFAQTMLARVTDEGDPTVLRHIWAQASALPAWQGAPCLVHADLHPLIYRIRNAARSRFQDADMVAPYYRDINPRLRDVMRATLVQTVQDWPG